MATKTLDELHADLRAVTRERDALRLKAKKIQAKIDPLLIEAEAGRRAHPSPDGKPQGIG